MKTVYTVIITFNGEKWIKKCLDSVFSSSYKTEVIVVDNCSTDKTREIIENEFKNVLLIKNTKNIGFGQASNIGIEYAINNNGDYIFLLNQDTELYRDTIEELVRIQLMTEGGIICPVQISLEGDKLDEYFFDNALKNKNYFSDMAISGVKDFYNLPFLNASAWLMNIGCVKRVGGFDPLFFHYGEDEDYCYRMKFKNEKLFLATKSFIKHYHVNFKEKKEGLYFTFKKNLRSFLVETKNINHPFALVFFNRLYELFLNVLRNVIRIRNYIILLADFIIILSSIFFLPKVIKSRVISKNKTHPFLKI